MHEETMKYKEASSFMKEIKWYFTRLLELPLIL